MTQIGNTCRTGEQAPVSGDYEDALKDALDIADLHYRFLSLGYFYSQLSKEINFTKIAPNINIETGENSGYRLDSGLISTMLNDIYSKSDQMDLFEHLTLLNSVRGIVGAMREALEDQTFREVLSKISSEDVKNSMITSTGQCVSCEMFCPITFETAWSLQRET